MYNKCCYVDRNMAMYDSRVVNNSEDDAGNQKEDNIIVTRFVRKKCKICGTKFKGKRVDTLQRIEIKKAPELKVQKTVKLNPKKVLEAAKHTKFGTNKPR